MKIYLADSGHNLKSVASYTREHPQDWNILLSYHYCKNINLDEWLAQYFSKPYPRIFLDSGAFSALTQGVSIDLHAYAQYIQKYLHLLELYANLDVIKNAAATWKNQQRLEHEYGLKPLPVFHVSEDWIFLEQYIEQYPYIALGVAHNRANVYMPWLVKCFKLARGKSVYHGFGITTWNVLTSFPWYSSDSTRWINSVKYGCVHLFDSVRGRFVFAYHGDHSSCYRYAQLFRNLGFDPRFFADRKHETYRLRVVVSMLSFLQAEAWLTKRWGKIDIPEREEILA